MQEDIERRTVAVLLMDIGPLLGLWLQTLIIGITMIALRIAIFVIVFGRMIEIYMLSSLAPIPFATLSNHDEVCCKRVKTTITLKHWQPAHS